MSVTQEILSKLPGTLEGLRQADALWQALRTDQLPIPDVVAESKTPLESVDWDVAIVGGTLGILMGVALVQRGYRVVLLERGVLRGREQEWNISRHELQNLVRLGLITEAELTQAVAMEFNPVRISFGGADLWVRDVLNLGVDPVYLLETLKQRFLDQGGKLLENTAFTGVTVHPNGVAIAAETPVRARVMLDGMGHFSPVMRQARQGQRPDAVCLVVGTCATGFPENSSGDLIASFTPVQNQCQYFWEAFPARQGRTTYLFTYLDADPDRPSLEALFEEYFRLLPEYQSVQLADLQFQRAAFGFFPCYRNSPLQCRWDRILAIGDSSGAQSPLSFGGFGAMIRHLERLTSGLEAALQQDLLDRSSLSLLQPYQPNLQVTWLFQKSMSVGMRQTIAPDQINQLLRDIFQEMQTLGDPVLRPFLQDVVQFIPLSKTLFRASIAHPLLIFKILPQVGLLALLDWMVHFVSLAVYSLLHFLAPYFTAWIRHLPPQSQYVWQRRLDAWNYGSGGDYTIAQTQSSSGV